jgi:electron transfer flavoprotein beta subunit
MKIITCCKWVADEADISVKADRSLDASRAPVKISAFDLNAIEAAMEIAGNAEGSTVTALSVGGKALENVKTRKDLLSRGPDALYLVMDDALATSLPSHNAQVLAAAAKEQGFDLIVCGDGSGDFFAQQTSLLLGDALDVPAVNGISKIVATDADKITVERSTDDGVETLEVPLPAVIAVTGDINTPRVPAMKAILAAGKKPVTVKTLADVGVTLDAPTVTVAKVQAPEQTERRHTRIEGDGDEQIAAFVAEVKKALAA